MGDFEGGPALIKKDAIPPDDWYSLEVISKLGFWSHIKAAAKFKPEEYVGISRT